MRTADVERIKLGANLLNAVASGIILATIVGPVVGVVFGTVRPEADFWNLLSFSLFGLAGAVVLHLAARRVVGRIEDDK